MTRKKRFLSAFLALAMALSLLPASAVAAAPAPGENTVYLSEEERTQYDEMLSERLSMMLFGGGVSLFSTGDYAARNRLSENAKIFYDTIKPKLLEIAKNGGTTKFDVPRALPLVEKDASTLFNALCADFPYEMYWRGLSYGYGSNENNEGTFSIEVSTDYRPENWTENDKYTVDKAKAEAASAKVAAAGGTVGTIVTTVQEQGLSDLEKLVYFKEEICRLVSYNDAAADWLEGSYGNPWQLIYVFDGDPGTKVVCEGYAKAFQYLCDLCLKSAQCYTVTGKMNDKNHMWNIVTLEGKNYLVDITNCDGFKKTSNGHTVSPGYPYGLFLAGATGSPKDGYYSIEQSASPFKYLWINNNDSISAEPNPKPVSYSYDDDTIWGDTILKLSETPYPINFYKIEETGLIANATYTWNPLLKKGFTFGSVSTTGPFKLPEGVSIGDDGAITYKTPASITNTPTEITIKAQYGDDNGYPYYYTLSLPPVSTGVQFTGEVPTTMTLNETPFTLSATASKPIENGTWQWSSSNEDVLFVDMDEKGTTAEKSTATVTMLKVGSAKITATYVSSTSGGDVSGAVSAEITVNADVTAPTPFDNLTYNGEDQPLVKRGDAKGGTMVYYAEKDGTKEDGTEEDGTEEDGTEEDRDYTDEIPTGLNAGTYTVYYRVEDKPGHYVTAPASVKVTINPKSVNGEGVSVEIEETEDLTYSGGAITPMVTVTDGDNELERGYDNDDFYDNEDEYDYNDYDYVVSYENYINAGTGTVKISGRGNYTGSKTLEFTIKRRALPVKSLTITDTYPYTGSAIEPDIEIKDVILIPLEGEDMTFIPGEVTLKKDTDYTMTCTNNTDVGTATVTVTGKGNYEGTTEPANFTITKAEKPEDVSMTVQVPLTATSGSIPLDQPEIDGSLGSVTYGTVTAVSAVEGLEGAGGITDGALAYTVTGTPADGDKVTFTVPVKSQNYEDFQITVELTFVEKKPQDTLTLVPSATTVVYPGTVTLTSEGGSGDGAVTYEIAVGGTGNGTIDGSVLTPSKAGTIKVVAKKVGTDFYLDAVSEVVEITVERASATIRADSKQIAEGEALPTFTYTVGPEGIAVTGVTIACEAGSPGKAGTYKITVSGPEVSDDGNYSITYVHGTLTVGDATAPTHEHAWAQEWSSNSSGHWHECTAAGCDVTANSAKDGYAGHVPGDWIIDKAATFAAAGSRHKECAVCGYVTQTMTIPSTGGGYDLPSRPGSSGQTTRPGGTGTSTGAAGQSATKPSVITKGISASAAVSSAMGDSIVDQEIRDRSGSIVIAPEIWDEALRTNVSVPSATVEEIGVRTEASLTVSTPVASVTIPNGSLIEIGREGGRGSEVQVTASATGKGTSTMTYEIGVLKDGKSITAEQARGITFNVPASAVKKARADLKLKTPAVEVTIPKAAISDAVRNADTLGVEVTETAGGTTYEVTALRDGEPVGYLGQPVKVSLPLSGQSADANLFAVVVNGYGSETVLPKSIVSGDGLLRMSLDTGSATVVLRRGSKTFSDADKISSWAKDAVNFVASRSLFTGTGDGSTFSPELAMQKSMLATVLHRLEGEPRPGYGNDFADVDPGSWYASAAAWAKEKGIVDGGDKFNGTENVTRQDLALMLYRYARAYGADKGESADISEMAGASDVAENAIDAMKWAVGAGIVMGSNNGLEPGRSIRRDEVAVMLMRFVEYLVR